MNFFFSLSKGKQIFENMNKRIEEQKIYVRKIFKKYSYYFKYDGNSKIEDQANIIFYGKRFYWITFEKIIEGNLYI